MPAGQVTGRISVKILPDTSTFRTDAQKQLDRIEKQLKVKVATTIDLTGAKRELLEGLREINAENKTRDARKIKFYTTISTDGMNGAIQRAVRELQARMKAKTINVKIKDVEVTGDVKLQLDDKSLKQVEEDIAHWQRKNNPVKIDVEFNWQSTAAAVVSARLGVLTRPRTVSVLPRIDKTALTRVTTALAALSGARVLGNIFEKLGNSLKNLDKSVPIIGTIALAIAGLSSWALTAVSNLFALSASLAQIGPAALLLPGLLGGMAVAIGVMIAAFKDFNKVLPEVKGQLSGLQDAISTNFWEKAAAPIRAMIDELLPEFTSGVKLTASQLGGFFGGLATGLKGALNPALTQMFTDLSKSITIATGGTGAFANIIAVLGQVGTSYLPQLAKWFVDISTKFSNFLSAAESDGRLKGWIDTGIQNLKDLGSVLTGLGGILKGISDAAAQAGGSSLAMVAETLHSVSDTINSADFQANLVDVFHAAHEAMSQIATQSGPALRELFGQLASLLTTILPQAGTIIGTALGAIASALAQPEITTGIKTVFDGLQQAVQSLAPAMAPLGKALGAIMLVIGPFAALLGGLVGSALTPLADAFAQLAPMLNPIIQLLGGALMDVIQQLAPVIKQLVPIVGTLLAAAFGLLEPILPVISKLLATILAAVMPLVKQLADALAPILPVLGDALGEVLNALIPIVDVALKIVTAIIGPLLPALSKLLTEVLPPLADAITRVLTALMPILDLILSLVNILMTILMPVVTLVVDILAIALVAAINGVGLVLEGLAEIFVGTWNIIKGAFEVFWGTFEGIFTGSWNTFLQGWKDLWNGIWNFVKGIWDVILGAIEVFLNVSIFGAVGKGFLAIKAGFVAGWGGIRLAGIVIWDTIKTEFGSFGETLAGIGRGLMSALGARIAAGWASLLADAGRFLGSLKTSISTGISDSLRFIRDLPGKARTALSGMRTVLTDAGKELIRGFIDGIGSMFDSVKDKLGSLTDKLKDWKGPAPLDRVLLVGAGQLVIDGFINGLESRYDAVRKSLRGLTEDVAGTGFDAPGIGQVRAAAGVSAAISGALSGALAGGGTTKVLNYYAAPGSSLSSEEDLFAAAGRARMGW